MAGRTRNLNVVITGDASGVNRAFRQVDTAAGQTESRMSRWGHTTSTAFKVAGAAAGGALVIGLKKSADAAIDAQKSQVRLEAQLKASGISYAAHAKQIDEVIQKTSRLAAVDDEDLQDAFTNLVRSTGNVNQSLKLLTLTTDLSRAKHLDLEKAAQLVGRVANGNVTALSRYGVTVDKNATAQEALAAAQAKFSGQAAAYGRSSAGALDRIGVASENLQEKVGSALLPVVARLANGLARLIGFFERNRTATTALIVVLGTAATAWAGYTAAAAAAAVATTVATGGITLIIPALAALSAAFAVAYNRSATFRKVVASVWDVLKVAVPQILAVRVALAHAGDAFSAARSAARGVGSAVNTGIIQPFGKIIAAGEKVISTLRSVGSAIGKVGSVAGSIGSALNPFGDGLGKASGAVPGLTSPLGTGPTGGLMGASSALAPFAGVGISRGLHVSSGKRAAGGRTVSGGISYHGSGEAVDLTGSPAGMMSTFQTLRSKYGGRLAELIYTPGGVGIKNGQPFTYTGAVAADHLDHVHVALDLGRPGPGIGDGPGATAARSLTGVNLAIDAARKAGFRGETLVDMVAIAGRESSYDPGSQNLVPPDHSIGLWQINQLAHKGKYGSDAQLKNAYTNARAAYALYKAAGLTPWAHAGGPLGGTDVAAARKAIAAFSGASSSGSSSTSSSGGASSSAGSSADTTSPYEARRAGVDLKVAEAQATPGARDDINALLKQDTVIAKRMSSIRAKLKKGGLSRATRVRLQGELTALTGERAGIQSSIKDARTSLLPVPPDDSGAVGGADDGTAALQASIDANTAAVQAHTDQLKSVADAIDNQTKVAQAAGTTQGSQAMKYIADQFGRQIVGSLPRPGAGLPFNGAGVAY